MYINRLIEFAEIHDDKLSPLGFKSKKIDWVVDIEENGFTCSPVEKEYSVPDAARSSNLRPFLIVDKPDYVFGMYEGEKDRERAKQRNDAYKALLDECVEQTGDKDISLLRQHLDIYKPGEKMKPGDFIVFRIRDEEYLHDKTNVKKFWEQYVESKVEKNTNVLPCMFCGTDSPVMSRHTIDILIGPDRTKMISANKNAYESHGLKNSLSAPTCYVCEQKYGKSLEYMLQRNKNKDKPGGPHMFRVGEMTYVYWLRGKDQLDNVLNLFASPTEEQSAEDMKDLLNQVFKGMPIERDINNFCMLAMTSNKGRLVVRDYLEDSVGNIKERIDTFFEAQSVGSNRYYGIYTLAATMYSEPRNQMQKYALEEWMGWFLYGRPLSGRILIPILKRIQAIGAMYPQHATAIKSWLVSNIKGVKWTVNLDENNKRTAYLTGRAFAVLERIQSKAIDSDNTIAGRFFGSASTTPKSIMGMLIRNSQNHLAKLKNDKKSRGLAHIMEKDLALILSELKEFPSTLDLQKQGEFALGYYHEKQASFKSKTEKGEQ